MIAKLEDHPLTDLRWTFDDCLIAVDSFFAGYGGSYGNRVSFDLVQGGVSRTWAVALDNSEVGRLTISPAKAGVRWLVALTVKHGEGAELFHAVMLDMEYSLYEYLGDHDKVPSMRTARPKLSRAEESASHEDPKFANLPPLDDPTDKRIWDLLKDDPTLNDSQVGLQVALGRQAVNGRRNALRKMGYPVRR